uniref:Membrane-bound lytic murein transglycosylase A n=1 Tax=uncultured Thiotrichaceae bacterium TaxID=298394 RepID=A0A6S6S7T0_9GAMM|nr:MAG: Membrane-bound lytic murein transglycosylase A precursor (EC [uncultured Thiotrichaceae bacterium]
MLKTLKGLGLLCLLLGALSGCDDKEENTDPQQQTNNNPAWDQLPGWQSDRHSEAWPALLNNCRVMPKKADVWKTICNDARTLVNPDDAMSKQFFEKHFEPQQLFAANGNATGFFTGYYEPLLHGSFEKDEKYKYPLYKTPEELLIVDLSSLYPELKGKRVRGRVVGNKVVPFYDRSEIDSKEEPLKGQEIIWVDNRDDVFFLQIQGSGRVQLPDGKIVGVGYDNQNGHPYVSIGKRLIESGKVERKHMNLFTLKDWLAENDDEAQVLLNENPSYVFFNLREDVEEGPRGSLNVPLVAERSIAVDRKQISLGSALWVDTRYPDESPLQKLVFAQDTGGAIRGELRGDFFFGNGEQAEYHAGRMKQDSTFYLLQPKNQ